MPVLQVKSSQLPSTPAPDSRISSLSSHPTLEDEIDAIVDTMKDLSSASPDVMLSTCTAIRDSWLKLKPTFRFPGDWPEWDATASDFVRATDTWINSCIAWGSDPLNIDLLQMTLDSMNESNVYIRRMSDMVDEIPTP